MKTHRGARRVALDPPPRLQPEEFSLFLPDPILDIVASAGLDRPGEALGDCRPVLLYNGLKIGGRGQAFGRCVRLDGERPGGEGVCDQTVVAEVPGPRPDRTG